MYGNVWCTKLSILQKFEKLSVSFRRLAISGLVSTSSWTITKKNRSESLEAWFFIKTIVQSFVFLINYWQKYFQAKVHLIQIPFTWKWVPMNVAHWRLNVSWWFLRLWQSVLKTYFEYFSNSFLPIVIGLQIFAIRNSYFNFWLELLIETQQKFDCFGFEIKR